MTTTDFIEWVNTLPINNEEDQLLHDELLWVAEREIQWVGGRNMSVNALKIERRERFKKIHKMLIERGLWSPFGDKFKMKYNPDKKKGGKKKKGGRRRI